MTQSANAAVLREVSLQQAKCPRKRKAYTVFTAEQRATIGKYLEKGLPEADSELDLQDLSENYPFS